MDWDKQKCIKKTFIASKFNYYPLILMFSSRKSNHGSIFNNNHSTFRELLWKDDSVRVPHRNLHSFGIEIYKIKDNIALQIVKNTFELKKPIYDIRSTLKSDLIWASLCNAKSKPQTKVFNKNSLLLQYRISCHKPDSQWQNNRFFMISSQKMAKN